MSDERRAAIGETTTSCYALRLLRCFATGNLEIGSRSERNVATIDKRGARNVGMSDERRGDRGGDHELLRLALIAALRDGGFGDRQSVREERRDDRQEGREERRDERREGAAIGEATTSCYALRLLRRFATGILEIGSRSERNVATIDKRGARNVGMSDERCAAIGEATTSCCVLRLLRRFATGNLEIGSRSERNVATIDKRGARHVGMSDESSAATAIRIETTAGRCGCKRPAVTWCRVVDQRGLLIARA